MGMTRSGGQYSLRAQLMTVLAGAALAIALFPIWRLEGRWFYIAVIGISLVCLSLVFVKRFSEFLMAAMFFVFPVASFTKWIGLDAYEKTIGDGAPYSGTLGIGAFEFVLAGLYFVWFLRVFVARTAPLPKPELVDGLALAVLATYLISIPGTHDVRLGIFATEYLFVHLLLYFYLSRNLEWKHLKWFMVAAVFALVLEAGIGIGQSQFGLASGLALDKGAGGEDLEYAYDVPGIEDRTRASGTLYDSHSLGLYTVMLLGYTLVFLYAPKIRAVWRTAAFFAILLGLVTLLVTYSRSAWLTCALALSLGVFVHIFVWRERRMLWAILALIVLAAPALPWALDIIYDRFANAPAEILSVRFELIEVALDIWRNHFVTGYGVGNYMYALDFYNFNMGEELPVHNMFLWIAAESGLIGLIAFASLCFVVTVRLWRWTRYGPDPLRRAALAALIGVVAYLLDGMTNPLFRDMVVYKMFWFAAALSVALPRLERELPPKIPTHIG